MWQKQCGTQSFGIVFEFKKLVLTHLYTRFSLGLHVESLELQTRFIKLIKKKNSGHKYRFVSAGIRPGHGPKSRDCPGHSGTLGNYECYYSKESCQCLLTQKRESTCVSVLEPNILSLNEFSHEWVSLDHNSITRPF